MTTKQMKAMSNMVVNGGNAKQAMLDAGYSKAMAKNSHKLTQSKAYKSMYAPLLKEHGVTINQYIKNIGDAMQATTPVFDNEGKVITRSPNHQTRLQGNKQAERFLFKASETPNSVSIEDMKQLAGITDEVELQRILFKRSV